MKNIKNYYKQLLKKEDGWTFMETLIVIAIIMVLTATVGFMAAGSLEKSKFAAAKTQIESLSTAIEAFYIDCGHYPSSEQGLKALRRKPESGPSCEGWNGPYIYKDVPQDPWGNEYQYIIPAPDGNPYGIQSYGADGMRGGDGKDRDISSWE